MNNSTQTNEANQAYGIAEFIADAKKIVPPDGSDSEI